ncbi:U4/U6.U5 tri-snRNP-associated protein snu66 [Cytospora mali]|uniref:U4/U6.U5 tri-snRNP-associated protein snu66 n=1 Tax=Cytospora mali TaxID=578113 RepID=A0A194UUR6_CYTMA|nr:U4/U6.U5 tri-snRNP-associated protein snu66 [Valsa mali var. pyri (nom. inval.)]
MDAAAIEDLNKVRKAMGLKPLPVPNAAPAQPREPSKDDEEAASTIETREAAAGDNYNKYLAEEKAKKDREARLATIKKEREKAQRLATLKGKGLGDLDDEDAGDAKSWIKGMKKKQKKIAEARQKEEEEEAAKAAAAKAAGYSSKDLAGVKVAHDMSTLLDGDDQVLTLKDTAVLDEEEGDELENMNLREQEKLNEKLDLKKKKPAYDPNDIDETGERSILAQYDEEINGKKKKAFTLDGQGSLADLADILEGPAQREKKTLQNLDVDMLQDAPASDYLDASEIKVKKPKKKKKPKSTRQRDEADALFPGDQADDVMDIDLAPVTKKRKVMDESFVDDDDLQASLALQRRQTLKKQKRVRPEDLAKQMKAEAAQEAEQGDEDAESGGLVIDETTEFLSAINKPELDEDTRPKRKSKSREPLTAMEDEPSDEEMENAPQIIKDESVERDMPAAPDDLTTTGVEEEKYVAQGLGATLSLLKERNIIDEKENGAEKNENFRQRQLFLGEQARLIAQVDEEAKRQRERDRASGHLDRMSARDREEYARRQNADREFKLSSIRANLLKKYRFNVELKYVDEQGRHLNQKEAFKELSHQFHGKTSGKGKTDKKLSKIEQEKSRMAKSIFDASQEAGMSSAMAQQTKKRKEAGVRLA